MKIGRFEVEQLSEGIFDVFDDGTFQKIGADEITAKKEATDVPRSSTPIGIDPILIRDGKHVILLDTGLGWGLDAKSSYTDTSNLKTNLDIFGLTPADVTHVVLSHLHFDHAAGSTFVDNSATTQPTMPYANYFVQKLEWHYAVQRVGEQNPVKGADYDLDELYKLHAEEKLVMITDTYFELLPGITLIKTGGHTPGHQIVKIQDGGETAYYLGDLVPSENHLNHYSMKNMDVDPIQSKKAKTLILRQAVKEKAALFFYHSIHVKNGVLVQDEEKRYALLEVK
ncbi:MAG: MBL fold metallo-hydrolase [Balneolaceae bacterium]|nr:MBL fold metallo-hydrolase [Balneolaceae bacterium]MBO6546605.1 MBL fold metallo-hydrolase [Balneolaceae bacterium]MBO6648963.1 MBL fold metallo-hydrolase [Balneolaceae bacterium]